MLKDIWLVIKGKLSWAMIISDAEAIGRAEFRARMAENQFEQYKRDLNLAQAAIAELKSQLPEPYVEEARRQASDDLAAQVLQDMQDNPKKFIP